MQSFFRANSNNNQQPMQSEMPMREPVYEQNLPDSQVNMTGQNDMWQNQTAPMQQQMQGDMQTNRQTDIQEERRISNPQQPTRPANHGFVAPSGNDNYFENSVAYQGAMQQILSENTGELVSVDFLIGTQETVTRRGILYSVGVSYIVLYNPENDTYVVCDLFAIKFVTFYNSTER